MVTKALMFYQMVGKGEKLFLLVHNAGGDHRFLEPQITMLSAFGRVLAVDLPGHGKSQSHGAHNDTLSFYAESILELCLNSTNNCNTHRFLKNESAGVSSVRTRY